tara:strand:- start:37 stop:618 length:582 start_codon:yes stop_codon:yes gene_type:complete
VSYRSTIDTFKVTCIDKKLKKYLYQIPITVDMNSSFIINSNRFMDIENGMDSIFLYGQFLGRSIKNKDAVSSRLAAEIENDSFAILRNNNTTLKILDNETAPELGQQYRVVVDHIKKFDEDPGVYTTRIIDCHHDAFIKLSDGSSFSEMEKNYGPPGKLMPIPRKSVLSQLRESVCGEKVETESSNNILSILE